jgi:hypothetical protein
MRPLNDEMLKQLHETLSDREIQVRHRDTFRLRD